MQHHVGAGELRQGRLAHAGLEQVGRLEEPGKVLEDELGISRGDQPNDRQPGGLCLGADDGEVLARPVR